MAILAALAVSGCDAHDYWALPHPLTVDSDADAGYNESTVSQDLFVRYQLDYEIVNKSESQPSEVVVSATSFVNSMFRTTGSRVWHLDSGESRQGILTTSQLQLGNSLRISLSSCAESRCSRREVLCPQSLEDLPDSQEIATFCYGACRNIESCIESCPSESTCQEFCKDISFMQSCRKTSCSSAGLASCAHICRDDLACHENCKPAQECIDTCSGESATCFRNCLATWTQCTEEVYKTEKDYTDDVIPCSLCGGDNTACQVDFSQTGQDIHVLRDDGGNEYSCDLACGSYPPECVTGCDALFETDEDRMRCEDACLSQFLFWCNEETIPVDYVNSSGRQPCCFGQFCQAELRAVVKSYDVECFNSTECGTGSTCSDEGVCVRSGTSECSTQPGDVPAPAPLFLLFAAAGIHRIRRRGAR